MTKLIYALVAFACLSSAAMAEEEKNDCTTEPQTKWMSEDALKAEVAKAGYHDIRSMTLLGSCYEIYALDAAGKRAEIYVDPVTATIYKSEE